MGLWDNVENIFPERGKQEQQDVVEDIMISENIRPKSVLAWNEEDFYWPKFFSERLPFSKVYGFEFEGLSGEKGDLALQFPSNNIPKKQEWEGCVDLDILLKRYKTNLFFPSNILDYGNWLDGKMMADTLADNEVEWVLFIHDVLIKDSQLRPRSATGFRMFKRTLKERGYIMKEYLNPQNPYGGLQYYLAIAPKRVKDPILEKMRLNSTMVPSFA